MRATFAANREARLAEYGFKPKVEINAGENVFTFDTDASVSTYEGKFGPRYNFDLMGDHEGFVLSASEYLAQLIVDKLPISPTLKIIMLIQGGKNVYAVEPYDIEERMK